MPDTTAAPAVTTPALRTIHIPAIGAHWPEHGGHFAGIAGADDSHPDRLLILGPEAPKTMTWKQAVDWAAKLNADGFSDWSLPTRAEQALLFASCKSQFQQDWYWSCEQFAGNESYAWCQLFYGGGQLYDRKVSKLRARAVRRLPV